MQVKSPTPLFPMCGTPFLPYVRNLILFFFLGAAVEAAAGSALQSGKELASWMGALGRARCLHPDEDGRHHIRRVAHLTKKSAGGLLRQVGEKQQVIF